MKRPATETASIDFSGINAGPAVRKIARELEIDLKKINGSGKNRMITKNDLKNFIHSGIKNTETYYAQIDALKGFGDFTIEKQSKIRALGAKNLYESWTSIPHVAHFEEIDITSAENDRKKLNESSEIKITPLSYLVRAVAMTLKEFPLFNSSLINKGEVMLRHYINLGIAVDTSDGLLVPVLKDADKLEIDEIAQNINVLANKAKNKKLLQKDLTGGTFTISSLGSTGGTGFTPIINPPEVAILGISRATKKLYLNDGNIIEKSILPVCLSYDHRVINGGDAGRFMVHLKELIERT